MSDQDPSQSKDEALSTDDLDNVSGGSAGTIIHPGVDLTLPGGKSDFLGLPHAIPEPPAQ